jgi:hypothetical protein
MEWVARTPTHDVGNPGCGLKTRRSSGLPIPHNLQTKEKCMKPILVVVVRNGAGETIAELSLEERPRSVPRENGSRYNEDRVTEAQRRMLFRLAASIGFEGERAREYVDRRLGPGADRRAASRLIDDLQDEMKRGNGGRDATP